MKPPKTIAKYDTSDVAFHKLVNLAVERVGGLKPGIKIRWSISLSYWSDDWAAPEKTKDMKVVPTQSSFSNL